jgi:DNA-binding MarR family transcriptional regulator
MKGEEAVGPEERERTLLIKDDIDALIHTMRLHHRVVERRIDGLGVHHSQHRLLMKLSRMGQCASQKDIASALDVSPACVARMLKPLNAAGLIEKAGGADGRSNAISISPTGERVVQDSLAVFRGIDAQMFEGISDAELAALAGALRRIQDNLANMDKAEACGPERREGSV